MVLRKNLNGPSSASPAFTEPATAEQIAEHNRRLDALVAMVQTIDRLGERFVGSEGKGLQLAASLLSKVI